MTPVETLREAARLMRERVEALSPEFDWYSPHAMAALLAENPTHTRLGDPLACAHDAAHIAAWHPAVALAVADWLDAEARRFEECQEFLPAMSGVDPNALAVARAYLGERP
jgi:hypothetical protein